MITEVQKEKIKNLLGKHYTNVILEYFQKNDIELPSGDPYTADYVRMVMNGRENERLEIAIYNAVQHERLRQAEETKRRNEILEKNPMP